mmetsp:Transcript_33046/g.80324  ORF Transcript_33046/g.80324 Transcript_33046/m.80324 type:complete len:96 (-) Transcript_33046:107-394(-)
MYVSVPSAATEEEEMFWKCACMYANGGGTSKNFPGALYQYRYNTSVTVKQTVCFGFPTATPNACCCLCMCWLCAGFRVGSWCSSSSSSTFPQRIN